MPFKLLFILYIYIYTTYMNKIKRNIAFFYYYNEQHTHIYMVYMTNHVKLRIFNRDTLCFSYLQEVRENISLFRFLELYK